MQSLLLCPDPDECAILNVILQRAGYTVNVTKDLQQTIHDWPQTPVEFILLTFRGTVSITLVNQIRAESVAPMLVITDPLPEEIHIKLWESTIDLVVIRPYSANLLLAQVRSLAKRTVGMPYFSLNPIQYSDISLNPSQRTVKIHEAPDIPLSRLEFRLLYTLMTHPGQIFMPENLIEHIWGYENEGNRNLVRGLIKRLRTKIEPDPAQPCFLLTQPGVGYFFRRHPIPGDNKDV
jgi:DNA-binding response OmpR family regulator